MTTFRCLRRPLLAGLAAAAIGAAGLLAGCTALNPDLQTRTLAGWDNYADVKAVIDDIVPYKTQRSELAAMGIKADGNPAITVLSFSDILQRFSSGSALRPEEYDRGIRDCLTAGGRCSAFQISVRHVHRDRVGNFLLDWLNFRRETDISGWSFSGIVLLVDDTVVYKLSGGQPTVHDFELVRNPLGPLQMFSFPVR